MQAYNNNSEYVNSPYVGNVDMTTYYFIIYSLPL